jgi:hypothetical protein
MKYIGAEQVKGLIISFQFIYKYNGMKPVEMSAVNWSKKTLSKIPNLNNLKTSGKTATFMPTSG